jgi:hypothetical protein
MSGCPAVRLSGCPADAYLFFMDLFPIHSSKKTHRYELSFLWYVISPSSMSGCPADAYLFFMDLFSHIHRRRHIVMEYLFLCYATSPSSMSGRPDVWLMCICFFMNIFSAYSYKRTYCYELFFYSISHLCPVSPAVRRFGMPGMSGMSGCSTGPFSLKAAQRAPQRRHWQRP